MSVTLYDPVTGEITAVRSGPSLDELMPLIGEAPFIEGAYPGLFYRVDLLTGEVVEK